MKFGYFRIPFGFILAIIFYLIYVILFTPNFFITLPLVFFPVIALKLLWIPGQLNVLFWGMMTQWLSVFIILFYCNVLGVSQEEFSSTSNIVSVDPQMMDSAVVLSTWGILSFLFGLFLSVRKMTFNQPDQYFKNYPIRKLFRSYIVISVFIYILNPLIWAFPAVVQYFHFFFYTKWGFFIILFYNAIKNKNLVYRFYLYLIIFIEFLLGLSSFFASSFLNILFFSFIGLFSAQLKLSIRHYFIIALLFGLIFHIAVLWTATKNEYRNFISQGTIKQVVSVSKSEAIYKIIELVQNVDNEKYFNAINALIYRVGYVYYFSLTLDYVPKIKNYQNGKIYASAFLRYLQPRFLFPNKEVLDDSKHTSEYTGKHFNGSEAGVSFSLGYVADAYIDFGSIGMMFLLLAIGYLFGYLYRFLFTLAPNVLWSWIFTCPFFLLTNIYGADTQKVIGALFVYSLSVFLFRMIYIKLLDPWMR